MSSSESVDPSRSLDDPSSTEDPAPSSQLSGSATLNLGNSAVEKDSGEATASRADRDGEAETGGTVADSSGSDHSDDHLTRSHEDISLRVLERKAALLDAAKDAIYVRELDGTVSYWNSGAESLYGWASEEVVGHAIRDLLYAEPLAFDRSTEELNRVGSWTGELLQLTRSGRTITADCRWLLMLDGDHQPAFVLCVVSDVTENHIKLEARYRAQRMESLGTLAGGIAHDLNNVLTPILISAQLLVAEESDPQRLQLLAGIENSVKHGSEMIRQVLAYSRGQEILKTLVDPRRLLTELEAFAQETLPPSVILTVDVPDDLWAIMGDTTQVLRVLMNLVTNARDAMPDGGDLAVEAFNVDGTGPSSDVESGKQLLIEVRDTGSGMSPETVSRIFEPFFTTKDVGRGTGLGLSTSFTIARAHGGDLRVRSEVGRGTTFQLYLPAALDEDDREEAPPQPIDAAILQGNGERVLVVDDEAIIRGIAEQILQLNGYTVLTASAGEEAVAVLDAADPPVDLVFTDMMMPGMDGAALATYARTHHPAIPVIAASGIAAKGRVASDANSGIHQFVAKPYTTVELLQAIRYGLTRRLPGDRG